MSVVKFESNWKCSLKTFILKQVTLFHQYDIESSHFLRLTPPQLCRCLISRRHKCYPVQCGVPQDNKLSAKDLYRETKTALSTHINVRWQTTCITYTFKTQASGTFWRIYKQTDDWFHNSIIMKDWFTVNSSNPKYLQTVGRLTKPTPRQRPRRQVKRGIKTVGIVAINNSAKSLRRGPKGQTTKGWFWWYIQWDFHTIHQESKDDPHCYSKWNAETLFQ